jgi:hypothetical protein
VTVPDPEPTSVRISVICPPLKTRSAVKSPSVRPVMRVVILFTVHAIQVDGSVPGYPHTTPWDRHVARLRSKSLGNIPSGVPSAPCECACLPRMLCRPWGRRVTASHSQSSLRGAFASSRARRTRSDRAGPVASGRCPRVCARVESCLGSLRTKEGRLAPKNVG